MTTVFKLADKVAAFKAKLDLWGRRVNRGIFDVSNISGDFGRDLILPAGARSPVRSQKTHELPMNGSATHLSTNQVNPACLCKKDQLLEIGLKSMFETTQPVFWIKVTAEYPEIATTALKTLLPFLTSYLCEAGFSALTATNRLIAEKQAQGSHWFSVMVSCIFHALYKYFCGVSYFEGMFKRYHSDQRALGGREDVTHVMLLARCYEDAANKVAYEYTVDSRLLLYL